VGYFENQKGLPPGDYSPDFLEIDAKAGPWLTECQRTSVAVRGGHTLWDLDLEHGVITFGTEERNGVLASVQMLGSYDAADGTWLWSWSNPGLERLSAAACRVRDEHPDIPEFSAAATHCTEAKAWALAAAAAHLARAEGCYRLPGEGDLSTFVALFDVTELEPGDPRGRRGPDPDGAARALAEYAGPAALAVGALLLATLQQSAASVDPVVDALQGFCDNLDGLTRSPLGRDTPAASEAGELADLVRQGAMCLALQEDGASLREGARELLELLHHVAVRYGAA
jgi:hypothetical protein